MRYLLPLLLLFFSQGLAALPLHESVPGGVAVIEVSDVAGLTYQGRPVLKAQLAGKDYAVIGIPLDASPGTHFLDHAAGRIPFEVSAHEYAVQRLTIENRRKVNPLPQDLERIGRERREMDAAFDLFTSDLPVNLAMVSPVDGVMSSSFGLRRILNDQPRSPHSGMDIAAPEGTAIHAPTAGVVAAVGDYFFNGNTVLLDHGQGLITMYCHMNEVSVEQGQWLDRGELIGRVGQTGRVTGPHLHWSISLNNARVNPALFLRSAENAGPAE